MENPMRSFATLVAGGALALGFAGTAGACIFRSFSPAQSYAAAAHVVVATIGWAWVWSTCSTSTPGIVAGKARPAAALRSKRRERSICRPLM
jgi:hypothetical protein